MVESGMTWYPCVQVRRWDVQTGVTTDTLNSGIAVYAVATAPRDGTGIVAFGGAERALRLWDSRARSTENLVSLSPSGLLQMSDHRSAACSTTALPCVTI